MANVISKLSCLDSYVGKETTLLITAENPNYRHTITYQVGNHTNPVLLVQNQPGGPFKWTIPTSAYEEMGTQRFVTIFLACKTYTETGEKIGLYETQFRAYAAPDSGPKVAIDIYDSRQLTRDLTGNSAVLVKGESTLWFEVSPNPQYGATVKSTTTYIDDKTFTTLSGSKSNVNSGTVKVVSQDSRQTKTTAQKTLQVIPYFKPSLACNSFPPDVNGNVKIEISGTFWNDSFGKVRNSITLQYRYKEADNPTWGAWKSLTPTVKGNSFTSSTTVTNFSPQVLYDVQGRVVDKIETYESPIHKAKSLPVYSWSATDFDFNVPADAKAGFAVKGKLIDSGTWTPTISVFENSGNYPTTASGNWVRFGDICYFNFWINGTFDRGDYQDVIIEGLPFNALEDSYGHGYEVGGYSNDGEICTTSYLASGTSGIKLQTAIPRKGSVVSKESHIIRSYHRTNFTASGSMIARVEPKA